MARGMASEVAKPGGALPILLQAWDALAAPADHEEAPRARRAGRSGRRGGQPVSRWKASRPLAPTALPGAVEARLPARRLQAPRPRSLPAPSPLTAPQRLAVHAPSLQSLVAAIPISLAASLAPRGGGGRGRRGRRELSLAGSPAAAAAPDEEGPRRSPRSSPPLPPLPTLSRPAPAPARHFRRRPPPGSDSCCPPPTPFTSPAGPAPPHFLAALRAVCGELCRTVRGGDSCTLEVPRTPRGASLTVQRHFSPNVASITSRYPLPPPCTLPYPLPVLE
eukprot:tig00021428_g21176.t1